MKILVTGGAGFMGSNLVRHLAGLGHRCVVFDNLSGPGVRSNVDWLREGAAGRVDIVHGDVRDAAGVEAAAADIEAVYHLAGQTAVTTSVLEPREDFNINALGTLNVLEAARRSPRRPKVVFASTNKVYGGLQDLEVVERDTRYALASGEGVSEVHPIEFHTPYGCCYSESTDVLTRCGWKKFYELNEHDEVLTYNMERGVAEFQRPTRHFSYRYTGKMFVQRNRRLETCVTPNHKMLVAWDCNHDGLEDPWLIEAQEINGRPLAYLLAADYNDGERPTVFVIPEVIGAKYKHDFPEREVDIDDWMRFLGWYLAEGHCYERKDGSCTVTLTTFYRTEEAVAVMKAVGLRPVVDNHHVTAASKQMYEYLKALGKSHDKYIPEDIKGLHRDHLLILLRALLDGDGHSHSRNGWCYTTVSKRLADDVQEIAVKSGLSGRIRLDADGFYRVYICTTRTAQCNLGGDRTEWVDYDGPVYCVEVPNSVIMVRQNGNAYFSGNSKGAADQYVQDYGRMYGLRTAVLRLSCIYGPRQFGTENQGWVAHFVIAAVLGRPLSIYGDGKQVRDLLFIDDLVRLYARFLDATDAGVWGRAYNAGGGPAFTLSLLELLDLLARETGRRPQVTFADWRPADQRVYVSDTTQVRRSLGWTPEVSPQDGVRRLLTWVQAHRDLFAAGPRA